MAKLTKRQLRNLLKQATYATLNDQIYQITEKHFEALAFEEAGVVKVKSLRDQAVEFWISTGQLVGSEIDKQYGLKLKTEAPKGQPDVKFFKLQEITPA